MIGDVHAEIAQPFRNTTFPIRPFSDEAALVTYEQGVAQTQI